MSGSFLSAFVVVKVFTGKNVMEHGTHNVGTMNTHRTTGNKPLTILVLLLDLAKGYLPFYLASIWGGWFAIGSDQNTIYLIAGLFAILGHNYSIFLKFKGGKGLATGAGFLLGLAPALILAWCAVWVFILVTTQYSVLGQLVASALVPLYSWFWARDYFWVSIAIAVPIVVKHAPRMKGVFAGKEPKMYFTEKGEK
ncbi:MAG TPA: glycerol-3-phosphate acyltransferase [Candidatus Wirthbacteria bacterium]|nr:glycerol-3-phosphate acyltransferase [Candidatus Wirthbacteria bacterium]